MNLTAYRVRNQNKQTNSVAMYTLPSRLWSLNIISYWRNQGSFDCRSGEGNVQDELGTSCPAWQKGSQQRPQASTLTGPGRGQACLRAGPRSSLPGSKVGGVWTQAKHCTMGGQRNSENPSLHSLPWCYALWLSPSWLQVLLGDTKGLGERTKLHLGHVPLWRMCRVAEGPPGGSTYMSPWWFIRQHLLSTSQDSR